MVIPVHAAPHAAVSCLGRTNSRTPSRHADAPRRRRLHPEATQGPHLRAAVEALIMAAESRGTLLHARVGMLRAMNHGRERVFSDRKATHWGRRKLKRDR